MRIVWSAWNLAHITKHGGSCALAEAVINATTRRMTIGEYPYGKITATVEGRGWTVVMLIDASANELWPITLYPTQRGGKRDRRSIL